MEPPVYTSLFESQVKLLIRMMKRNALTAYSECNTCMEKAASLPFDIIA
jgi:hypothetical protein